MSSPGTVLVLGGTGTTGSRLAARLREQGAAARVATRRPAPGATDQVRFAWADRSTHATALAGADATYLVAPIGVHDPRPLVEPFVEEALRSGVRRVVLLSSSAVPESDDPGLGDLHRLVRTEVPEWAVLRPSWFMQNVVTMPHLVHAVRERGEIATATRSGRLAFIDAEDIAAVAARALLDPTAHDTEHVLTGPAALSYADVAAILSAAGGRPVVHRALDEATARADLVAGGVPPEIAAFLVALDADVAAGGQDFTTPTVQEVTGRPPRTFEQFATDHAAALAA